MAAVTLMAYWNTTQHPPVLPVQGQKVSTQAPPAVTAVPGARLIMAVAKPHTATTVVPNLLKN